MLCGRLIRTKEAIRLVTDTLNGELKIKETGRITSTGGKITFLGREIERQEIQAEQFTVPSRDFTKATCKLAKPVLLNELH